MVRNTELPDVVERVSRKFRTEAERLSLVPSITKGGKEASNKMTASCEHLEKRLCGIGVGLSGDRSGS